MANPQKLKYRSLEDLNKVADALIAKISWGESSIRNCYEVAKDLIRQADVFRKQGDTEREYTTLMKYASIHMEKLPQHKQYNDPQVKTLKAEAGKQLQAAIAELERLKALLRIGYDQKMVLVRAHEEAEAIRRQQQAEAEAKAREFAAQEARAKAEKRLLQKKVHFGPLPEADTSSGSTEKPNGTGGKLPSAMKGNRAARQKLALQMKAEAAAKLAAASLNDEDGEDGDVISAESAGFAQYIATNAARPSSPAVTPTSPALTSSGSILKPDVVVAPSFDFGNDSSDGSDLDALMDSDDGETNPAEFLGASGNNSPFATADNDDDDLLLRAKRLRDGAPSTEKPPAALDSSGISSSDIEAVFLFGLHNTPAPAPKASNGAPLGFAGGSQVLLPQKVENGPALIDLSTVRMDRLPYVAPTPASSAAPPNILDMTTIRDPAATLRPPASAPVPSAPPLEEEDLNHVLPSVSKTPPAVSQKPAPKSDPPSNGGEMVLDRPKKPSSQPTTPETEVDGFSFTKTHRNQQLDPSQSPPVAPAVAGPTCLHTNPTSSPSPHHGAHNHSHAWPPPSMWPGGVAPPTQFVQYQNQQVPVVYSPMQNPAVFQNAQQVVYQPGPDGQQAHMPVMYGVPMVFRPSFLNIYNPLTGTTRPVQVNPDGTAIELMPKAPAAAAPESKPATASPTATPVTTKAAKPPTPPSAEAVAVKESPRDKPKESPRDEKPKEKPVTPPPDVAATRASPTSTTKPSPTTTNKAATSAKPTTTKPKPKPLPTNGRPVFVEDDLLPAPRPPILINGLREIEVDGEIFDGFMYAAHSNTVREIETCGILCGRLRKDESGFTVTHLIIPKQTGTTDTCATTNEDEIFEYQMKHDLLTLGWIHTHPTQACFLSSVDLHTQASYQGLFPEALAVVIAPKDRPNFSIFHLTDGGLGFVQSCPLKGFHLHDQAHLYESCRHVKLRWNKRAFKVVDMRKR